MKRTLLVCCLLAAFCWVAQAQQTPASLRSSDLPPNPERSVLPIPVCPWNTLFGQVPTHPDSLWIAWTSDIQFPYLVFDNFWELEDSICDIHWWGLTLGWDDALGWFVCDEDPMTFEIKFYMNAAAAAMPGAVMCTYTVTVARQPTGLSYFGWPLYYWSAVLDTCCVLSTGWVSIQGISPGIPGTPNCAFLWMDSPQGDNSAFQQLPTGGMQPLYDDLAFCLTPGGPEHEMDMGDIVHPLNTPIGYPTLVANPGHLLSGIAWLGANISGEPAPNIFNIDPFDDGASGPPFMIPCRLATVTVTVTAGPNYPTAGMPLFLSAWKDGNNDGDFCDSLCPDASGIATVSEWIIQDAPVAPGVWTFRFIDPGLRNVPPYAGWFRLRLTSVPVGPLGFGLGFPSQCPGTWGVDRLGEVEDYFQRDYQMAVELTSFEAVSGANEVVLSWVTASETDNDYFELERDGRIIGQVPTKGNDASGHSYVFSDGNVNSGTTYSYTLASVDLNGNREVLATRSVTPDFSAAAPVDYALYQNYPNPFNATTTFVFDLKEATTVSLKLYNVAGQEVASVLSGELSGGRHEVSFDASGLPSGMYLYRLDTPSFSAAKKMLLMK
jgi:hypothetical protein